MPPSVLAVAFLVVMAAALACFSLAYLRRADRGAHVRLAVAGFAIDVVGTIVVLVTHRYLGWVVPERSAAVAGAHRALAYVVTGLLLVQAYSGARRLPLHRRLGLPFLVLYAVTYALAVAAYAPL